jgi:hypothetical protein
MFYKSSLIKSIAIIYPSRMVETRFGVQSTPQKPKYDELQSRPEKPAGESKA